MRISESEIAQLVVQSKYGSHVIRKFLWQVGPIVLILSVLLSLTTAPASFMNWLIAPLAFESEQENLQ